MGRTRPRRRRVLSDCWRASSQVIEIDLRAEVRRLKSSVSLVATICATVALKRTGRLHVGLCPFHGEKTPSFTVYGEHYHCFGCGAHGDVFTWLMQAYRMSFTEAVAHLSGGGQQLDVTASRRPEVLAG